MSFQSDERERLRRYAKEHFGVDGHVLPRELAHETLYEGFREQTLAYFASHGIKWWTSRFDVGEPVGSLHPLPTGHLNSSQVACVNRLGQARADPDCALAVARAVDAAIDEVFEIEGGYVAYEWIGAQDYLGESGGRTRGANVTSLDALMRVGRRDETVLVAFEWKYLESYGAESRARSRKNTDRIATYRPLLEQSDCPIAVADLAFLFYDPYEQLMRQTLLAWQMAKVGELGASDWLHVSVVPALNVALRMRTGSAAPDLIGRSMADAWRSTLKEPTRYQLLSPTELLVGLAADPWRTWLHERYLT